MPVPLVRVKRKREDVCCDELIIEAPRAKKSLSCALDTLSISKTQPNAEIDRHRFRRLETLEAQMANNAARESDSALAQELVQKALALRGGGQVQKRIRDDALLSAEKKRRKNGHIWAELKTTTVEPVKKRKTCSSLSREEEEIDRDDMEEDLNTISLVSSEEKFDDPNVEEENIALKKRHQVGGKHRVYNPAERRMDKAIFDVFNSKQPSQVHTNLQELFEALDAGQTVGLGINFSRPRDGTTALMAAAWQGSIPDTKALLNRGADPSRIDLFGNTAAVIAMNRGHNQLSTMLMQHLNKSTSIQNKNIAPAIDLDNHKNEAVVVLPETTNDDLGYVYDIYAYQDQPTNIESTVQLKGESALIQNNDIRGDTSPSSDKSNIIDSTESDDENASTRCVASPAPNRHAYYSDKKIAQEIISEHGTTNTPLIVGIDRPLKIALTAACIRPSSSQRRRTAGLSFDTSSISSLDFDGEQNQDDMSDGSSLDSNNENYIANDYPDEEGDHISENSFLPNDNQYSDYDDIDDSDDEHEANSNSFRNRPVPDFFHDNGFADATPLAPPGFRIHLEQHRTAAL
mmetsp:Transcript_23292/g.30193  ORF Transcript_23292/g.30193 Transcript_23292/m.30193 type:complete len:574 (+) Transcript_23292:53-1774(+)